MRSTRSPIETDPNRTLIERALALGQPATRVARQFGYSVAAVHRHKHRMPAQLKAAIAAAALKPKAAADLDMLRLQESEGILGNLAHQRARLLMAQDEGHEAGDLRLVGYLAGHIHENIKLAAQYLGVLATHHVNTNVSLLLSEDYVTLRRALATALQPYPEARRAVIAELQRIEEQISRRVLSTPQNALIDPASASPVRSNGAAEASP